MRRSRIAFVLIATLALLAGCGTTTTTSSTSSGSGSSTGSNTTLCTRVTSINQALTQLSNVGEKTTVGDVKAMQQKLTTALGVLSKLPNGGGSAVSDIEAANNELTAAIKDQPDSATLGQIGPRLQTIKAKAAKAQTATTKLATTLKCSS